MNDALTSSAARAFREDRERTERAKPAPRLAAISPEAPPPESEEDYGIQAPTPNDATKEPTTIVFTPTMFKRRDPATFPRREFLYGSHYVRKYLTVTAAQTKVGKSFLSLVEAVAMASGKNLLGTEPNRRLRVWYWNGEDPQDELDRRVVAICRHYEIDQGELEGYLFLDNGRETKIIVAAQTKDGITVATPVEEALTAALIDGEFDVLTLDPAVKTHRVPENDNGAIDAVAETFAHIADAANVAVEVVGHTRKLGGAEATLESARGGSSWTSAARDVRVLNRMTKEEGEKAGIELGKERHYFRADADGNLAPPSATEWFKIASVGLGNFGEDGEPEDSVGVVTPWAWPNALDGLSVSDLCKAQAAVAEGRWRANCQAKDWVGVPIAKALGLDPSKKADRAKVIGALKIWSTNGMFVVVEGEDAQRKKRSFIEVGAPAND
jgi:hypothetical protein